MRNLLPVVCLGLVLTGCGCVPARVQESVLAGEARARKAAELVRKGVASLEDMRSYILAEEEDWAAVRRAIEQ